MSCGAMKKVIVPRSLLSYKDDVIERVTSILANRFKKVLEHYKNIKNRLRNLREEENEITGKIHYIEKKLEKKISMLAETKSHRDISAVIGSIFLIAALIVAGQIFTLSLFFILITLGTLLYAYNQHQKASQLETEINSLLREKQSLEINLSEIREEIKSLESALSSFKVPVASVKAYRVYVPIGIQKLEENGGYLLFTPWSRGEKFKLSLVVDREALSDGFQRLQSGEEIYIEGVIREKDVGYKIYRALSEMKLWEKVLSSRSPEELLREAVFDATSMILSSIEEEEISLGIEKAERDVVDFIINTVSGDIEVQPGEPADQYLEEDLKIIEQDFEEMINLITITRELREISRFVKEAKQLEEKSDIYSKLIDEAVRKLIEVTVPMKSSVLVFWHNVLFCPKCAASMLDRYMAELDFRRWVFDRVLGGVDQDPDIVTPHPLAEKIIKERWRNIIEKSYRLLPLPGVNKEADLEEMAEGYKRGLKMFALIPTGADEMIELKMNSPFDEPTVRCNRCGTVIHPGEGYYLKKLYLPLMQGYMGLLYETVDKLSDDAMRLGTKIVDSKRTKDERKTTVGIYQQTVQMYIQKKMDAEAEIKRLEKYVEDLKKYIAPMLGAETVATLTGFDINVLSKILEEER